MPNLSNGQIGQKGSESALDWSTRAKFCLDVLFEWHTKDWSRTLAERLTGGGVLGRSAYLLQRRQMTAVSRILSGDTRYSGNFLLAQFSKKLLASTHLRCTCGQRNQ